MKNILYLTTFSLFVIYLSSSIAISDSYHNVEEIQKNKLIDKILHNLETSITIEEEWIIETKEGHTQKLETLIHPEMELKLPFGFDLTSIVRFRLDAVDNLEHGDSSQSEISPASRRGIIGDRIEFELREFYFEKYINNIYLKVGKQQIVWGNSDGLKVLDIVNPQDFREFIYDEWDDSRIPLWTVNVEIPLKNWLMQLIWIPDKTYHKIPEPNSTFSFTSPMIVSKPPPGVKLNINSIQRPKRFFSDSDMGIRFSRFWSGWDITLNYLYHYDDVPVPFSKVSFSHIIPEVNVSPSFKRSHMVGGTFSNAFGNLVIRGELGHSFNKYFVVNDRNNRKGVVEADEFSYVLGFDWSGIENTFLSLQLFQGIITNSPSGLIRDQVETNISFYVSHDFFNTLLHTEFIWLQNLNKGDGFFQPRISYQMRDEMILKTGFDLFYGGSNGLFGQFDNNDRFILAIEFGL